MNTEEIYKAIKETFKTKVEQKEWMWRFQHELSELEEAKERIKIQESRIESFFDMIGLNKLSKQEWREKYVEKKNSSVLEKDVHIKENGNK